jgi:DNA-binding beta-propeller fold protein YncE
VVQSEATQGDAVADLLRQNRVYFLALALWWSVGSWISYTIAGEKMPWLLVHMALPMCVLGGWWIGRMVRMVPWGSEGTPVRQAGAIWLLAAAPVLLVLLAVLVLDGPKGGRELDAVASVTRWLVAAAIAGVTGFLGWRWARQVGAATALRLVALGMVGLLLLLTVRFSYMLNFVNFDLVTEYLVYAHGSPDIKRALAEIDRISERTVGGRNLAVAYDDDSSWPLSWYMRQYPNARFYGDTPNNDAMASPVIIVGPKNYDKVHPYVTRDYVKRTYRLVWWPDQGYFGLTLDRIISTLRDRTRLERIFDIVFYRRYADDADPNRQRDLTQWPNRHDFEMWVRRDIAEQIWDLNVTPLAAASNAQEEIVRSRTIELSAVGSYSGQYGSLSLVTPRTVAVAPDGSQVIADSGNHRIVVLDANGDFVREMGGLCRLSEGTAGGCVDPDGAGPLELGDGQLNEPWGVTVDSQGQTYVADTWNGRIQVFGPDGAFLRKWGYFNTTNGELGDPLALFGPRGLTIDLSGNLLVADTGNKRILQFTPTGELVQQIGGGGVALGRFEEPTDVAVDPRDGSVFVADAWNRRIQKLDPALQPLAEWPVTSWDSEHLYHKPYLAVSGSGDVYASDPANFRILVYNSAGGLKAAFGSFGPEMNQFALPTGLAWNSQANTVLVADSDNQRIQVFPALP